MTNTNPNEVHAISQSQALLELLLSGYKITVLDGYRHLDCVAVSQRISELNRWYGWNIRSQWIKTNTGKLIKQYTL